jgi:ribosomal protein S18 acetylase RimI-like enzyme
VTIRVRRAGAEDQPACTRIFIETVTATFPNEPAQGRTAAAYADSVAGEEQWVALIRSDIIGYISVYWPTNFIHSLYVLPIYQSRGAGRALLAEVRKLAKGDLELKTDKANARAFAYYRHLGWRVIGEGIAATGPWWRLRWSGGIL